MKKVLPPITRKKKLPPLHSPGQTGDLEIVSAGVMKKPSSCFSSCPLSYHRTGFVADYLGENAKIAFLTSAPLIDDTATRVPWTSGMGKLWRYKFVYKLGLKDDEVAFFNLLRCGHREGYPTGPESRKAEKACREHDTMIQEYAPDLFIVTLDPEKIMKALAFQRLIKADVQKAIRFAEQGARPLVIMGKEATNAVAPWLFADGSIKDWRGHYWSGTWEISHPPEVGFLPVKEKRFRRKWKS